MLPKPVSGRHEAFELADRVRLDLADALRRDVIVGGQLMQGRLLLAQPSTRNDIPTSIVQLG